MKTCVVACFAALIAVNPVFPLDEVQPIEDLRWMVGCWRGSDDGEQGSKAQQWT